MLRGSPLAQNALKTTARTHASRTPVKGEARFVSIWYISYRNGLDPRDRPSRDGTASAVGPDAVGSRATERGSGEYSSSVYD